MESDADQVSGLDREVVKVNIDEIESSGRRP